MQGTDSYSPSTKAPKRIPPVWEVIDELESRVSVLKERVDQIRDSLDGVTYSRGEIAGSSRPMDAPAGNSRMYCRLTGILDKVEDATSILIDLLANVEV